MPAKKPVLSATEQVDQHIQKLDPSIAETVQYIRQTILSTDSEIGEEIKWNSPSFYFTGAMKDFDPKEYKRDVVVMNLHRGNVLLVFPTGSVIDDTTGILEGKFKDTRKTVSIASVEEAQEKSGKLQAVIKNWLGKVDRA